MVNFKVAFALRPIDDFSGKTILKRKFIFKVDGENYHPIEKEEGLYIFLEPMNDSVSLDIEESNYHICHTIVNKKYLDRQEPVADIRLYGKTGKSFPYPYDIVQGKIEEKKISFPTQVCAIRKQETGLALKEVKQFEKGTFLFLNGFTKESLLGKTFSMGNGKNVDVFILAEKTGINEYRIEGQLLEKHKAGTPLKRAYRSVTDECGYYSIPVDIGEGDSIMEVIALQNSKSSS